MACCDCKRIVIVPSCEICDRPLCLYCAHREGINDYKCNKCYEPIEIEIDLNDGDGNESNDTNDFNDTNNPDVPNDPNFFVCCDCDMKFRMPPKCERCDKPLCYYCANGEGQNDYSCDKCYNEDEEDDEDEEDSEDEEDNK
jgi:hypothetical protein